MKKGQIDQTTGVTDGAMRTLLKSNLRPIWRNTSRKLYINSVRYHTDNPKTGRKWYAVDCRECGRVMGVSQKEKRPLVKGGMSKKARCLFEVHHIHGVTPLTNIKETLGLHFDSLIYGELEILCISCHKKETAIQSKQRNQK